MPGILDEVEQLLNTAKSDGSRLARLPEQLDHVGSGLWREAVTRVNPGMVGRDLEDALGAASNLRVLARFNEIMLVYQTAVWIMQLSQTLQQLAGRLPRVIGKPIQRAIHIWIPDGWIRTDLIKGWVDMFSKQAGHAHVAATAWANRQDPTLVKVLDDYGGVHPPLAAPPPNTPAANRFADVYKRLDHLAGELATLESAITPLEQPARVPQQLWNEIHALQSGQIHLARAVNHLADRLNAANVRTATLEAEVPRIEHEIGGLRQISVGWQDIAEAVTKLEQTLPQQLAQRDAAIHHNTAAITALSPLALLLQPGPRGLRNLRKLEDNICQCPKFGGIPNEWGTALALMEFIENG